MPTDTFDKALSRLDAGDVEAVRQLARPMLLDADSRADALYLLGRVYQIEGKPHAALYLLEQAASRACPPDTAQYLAESRAQVEASGWTEDFTDRGHTVCGACRLYYRAEYPECPYCRVQPIPDAADNEYEDVIGNEELGWEDDVFDKADRIGRGVIERAREIADSKTVKEMSERARTLSKDAVERARVIADKEEIREAARRAKQIGTEASESARKLLDSDTAKHLQESTRETSSNLAQHARNFVTEERARYDAADEAGRRAIFIKWIGAGIVFLILIRVLAWIL